MLLERHGSVRAERNARTIARALELAGDGEGARTWRLILEERFGSLGGSVGPASRCVAAASVRSGAREDGPQDPCAIVDEGPSGGFRGSDKHDQLFDCQAFLLLLSQQASEAIDTLLGHGDRALACRQGEQRGLIGDRVDHRRGSLVAQPSC